MLKRSFAFLMVVSVSSVAAPSFADELICVPGSFAFGDYDGKGDIALLDYSALANCMSGPDSQPSP